jgi:hypothetical protein
MVPRGYDKFFNNGAVGWPCVYSSPLLLSARYFLGTYRCKSMDAMQNVALEAPRARTRSLRSYGSIASPHPRPTSWSSPQARRRRTHALLDETQCDPGHQDTVGEENRGTVNVSERFVVSVEERGRHG